MFRGSSAHTLDSKGRIIIPSRFRNVIREGGEDAVMITSMDNCLFAYALDEWGKIEEKILSLAEKSAEMRRFRRVFVGGAFECACDKQGRVLVPPTLRDYAQLGKDIVLVGVLDHFEIWSKDNWEKENQLMESDMLKEAFRGEISRLGL
jgi:transcriptional regulator MraZ